jgi:hypothetical protein
MITCPYCGTTQRMADAFLGKLGKRRHYCCRYCGGQFSKVPAFRKKKGGEDGLSARASGS